VDLNSQINLEHLLFVDRKCRVCGEVGSLLTDFYLTRKDRGAWPSAYSYECKKCTIQRIKNSRRKKIDIDTEYPNW
jgi:hypothetical protein